MSFRLALLLCLMPGLAPAQGIVIRPLDDPEPLILDTTPGPGQDGTLEAILEDVLQDRATAPLDDVVTETRERVSAAPGARLRGLDKVAGSITDFAPSVGETVRLGWLDITLGDCRYPTDNPAGDAYAWLTIRERAGELPVFEGWMVASSPALSALDHARYDVWVLGCSTPAATAAAGN